MVDSHISDTLKIMEVNLGRMSLSMVLCSPATAMMHFS